MVSLVSDDEINQIADRMANLTAPSQSQASLLGQAETQDSGEVLFRDMASQFKNLTAAMTAQGVFQIVKTFEGDPRKFKTWVKEIEKYARLVRLENDTIPNIAYQTSSGSVSDFIKRYIDSVENIGDLSWEDLKKLLRQRFAGITDSQQAMDLLRKTRQGDNESVQIYSERLLQVAEDAYPNAQEADKAIVQQQLVNAFCDGLAFDYLKMKVMREDPKTLEDAVRVAMREQNLRKRFNLRKDENIELSSPIGAPQSTLTTLNKDWDADTRHEVPMEVDHTRQKQCFRCKQANFGQSSAQDRHRNSTRQQPHDRYPRHRYSDNHRYSSGGQGNRNRSQTKNYVQPPSSPQVQALGHNNQNNPSRAPDIICWQCNESGHYRRNCPRLNDGGRNKRNKHLN